MAQKKLAEAPREAAQIVMYLTGVESPLVIRYHDMKEAMKQFARLLKAADQGKQVVLKSACMTLVFRFPQNMSACYLVDVETNSYLLADTQKRMNAMMQA